LSRLVFCSTYKINTGVMKNKFPEYKKKTIILLALAIIVGGGYKAIFKFIENYIVKYITNKIDYNSFVSFIFVVIAIGIITMQLRLIKNKYKPSFTQVVVFLACFALYILALTIGDIKWQWHYFFEQTENKDLWYSFIFKVKLVDVLILLITYPVVFALSKAIDFRIPIKHSYTHELVKNTVNFFRKKDWIKADKRPIKQLTRFFEHDNALDEPNERYEKLSGSLIDKLLNETFQNAFSIGIIGPWGNGKTSFINHVKRVLKHQEKQNVEVINFSPAFSNKPEQIIEDYFSILALKLKKYDGRLNQTLISYLSKLMEVGFRGSSNISGLLKADNWLFHNKPAYLIYNDLRVIFGNLQVKVFVFIDDVDRLEKPEIMELLKIIRNTSDFPNVVFFVAYDKDYVVKTIDKDISYMEKYFQYELFVPPHTSRDLIVEFATIVLSKNLGNEGLKEAMDYSVLSKIPFSKFITNFREVKTIANSYCMNMDKMGEDVDCIDMLLFTIMNRLFPKQMRYIYDHFSEVFESLDNNDDNVFIKVKEIDLDGNKMSIDDIIERLSIDNLERKRIFKELFLFLFNQKDNSLIHHTEAGQIPYMYESKSPVRIFNYYKINNSVSIINIDRIHIYFETLLRKDDISTVEFSIKITTDKFIDYTKRLIENSIDTEKMKIKIGNKVKEHLLPQNLTMTKNIIYSCHSFDGNPFQFFNYSLVHNTNIDILFEGYSEKDFYNSELWYNRNIPTEFKINTILGIYENIALIRSNYTEYKNAFKNNYLGYAETDYKDLLIKLTQQYFNEIVAFNSKALELIAQVFDSSFDLKDEELQFGKYLYSDIVKLKSYLYAVSKYYKDDCKFYSAIFKVFTNKEVFKDNCFKWAKEELLIKEFYHLLELHELRVGYVSWHTPFFFTNGYVENDIIPVNTIYVKLNNGRTIVNYSETTNKTINITNIYNPYIIIEGEGDYGILIKELSKMSGHPFSSFPNLGVDFEIFSIQTHSKIPEDLKKHITYYKRQNEEAAEIETVEETEVIE